jgi:hypothetical protein
MPTILILTEEALRESDVKNILNLHDDPEATFEVLVPADTERNIVTDFIDHLSLFEMREAWDSLIHRADKQKAEFTADISLGASLERLSAAGATASGSVIADDPLPAVKQAVNNLNAAELIVVTRPHAVEDTFHKDWASRAREELGVPVLHFYAGTDFVG